MYRPHQFLSQRQKALERTLFLCYSGLIIISVRSLKSSENEIAGALGFEALKVVVSGSLSIAYSLNGRFSIVLLETIRWISANFVGLLVLNSAKIRTSQDVLEGWFDVASIGRRSFNE